MIELKCENCGNVFYRHPSQVREHNFCSRKCSRVFTSSRMTKYNRTENIMNTSSGWTEEKREEQSARNKVRKGVCKKNTYEKHCGMHKHREVAERVIGRKLLTGEVVHHKDGNKHNNSPENIMVFENRSEHMKYHAKHPEESGVRLGRKVVK